MKRERQRDKARGVSTRCPRTRTRESRSALGEQNKRRRSHLVPPEEALFVVYLPEAVNGAVVALLVLLARRVPLLPLGLVVLVVVARLQTRLGHDVRVRHLCVADCVSHDCCEVVKGAKERGEERRTTVASVLLNAPTTNALRGVIFSPGLRLNVLMRSNMPYVMAGLTHRTRLGLSPRHKPVMPSSRRMWAMARRNERCFLASC